MGKLDTFGRTIEGCDFITFRELAIFTLPYIGLKEVKLTDGWRDGGTDVKVGVNKGTELNLAVQISVERKWQSKIIGDLRKIKSNYSNVRAVYFISSRRIQERDFETVRQQAYKDFDINLFKYDNQGISSVLLEAGKVEEGLTKINYDVPKLVELRKSYRRFDPNNSAMLSLLFFSNEISETRDIKLSSEIISLIFESGNKISEAGIISGLDSRYIPEAVKKGLTQLRGKDEIHGTKDAISLKRELYETIMANELVKTQEISDLKSVIEKIVLAYNKNRPITSEQCNQIIENLGSFYAISSGRISSQLNHTSTNLNTLQLNVKEGIKRLHILLDELGVDPQKDKDDILNDICSEAAKTNLMESLAAAEVIRSLENLTSDDLLIALGAENELIVILDSSVSIPILCSYLFEPTKESFVHFSYKTYEACSNHNIALQTTREYVEEMATHLISAHTRYYDVIKIDKALAYSENGYVAQYVGLLNKSKPLAFEDFLEHMGLTKKLQANFPYTDNDKFHFVKGKITQTLIESLQKAGVSIMDSMHVPFKTKKNVESEISFALKEVGGQRPKILLDHDVLVISYLKEKAKSAGPKYVILTWDKVHFTLRSYVENANWETFDPPTFLDILHMCKPEQDLSFGNSSIVIVKKMREEAFRNVAVIWDSIAEIEKENFNAVLVQKAKGFKNDYLQNSENIFNKDTIKNKWKEWKENSNNS
jgi:hypothetical protein